MTTTTDKIRTRIIALRDRARHANTPKPEAETALALARKLCAKYGIDVALLDAKPEPQKTADPFGFGTFVKKYPCRFGCGMYVQHTIEELNACAEKARANGGNAYAGQGSSSGSSSDWFDDFLRGYGRRNYGTSSSSSTDDDSDAFYTDRRGYTREHRARANGPHAYCDHPATKSARAKCRKDRGY